MLSTSHRWTALAAVTVLALASCGGDDSDAAADESDEPAATDAAPAGAETTESPDSSSDDGDDGATEISGDVTLWMFPVIADEAASADFWGGVETDFEAINPGVDLTIELQPWEGRDEKIATAIAAGQGPDLVLLGPDQVLQYQESGGLLPLTSAVESGRDVFLPSALEAATVDGDTYAVPIYHTATTTVYNRAAFEAAGITELPTTWDAVLDAAPALAEQGVAILDYSGSPEETLNLSFYPLLWQAGGSVFAEDGSSVAFNSPEGVAALQFLLDLQAAGGLPPDAATKSNSVESGPLGSGEAAMGLTKTKSEVEQMMASLGDDAVTVGSPLTGEEPVSFGLPGLLARTAISDEDAAANAVAEFISGPTVAVELAQIAGFFPARSDATLPDQTDVDAQFIDALSVARSGEAHPQARQVMSILATYLQSALLGDASAQEALDAAAAEANALIAG